MNPTLVVLLCFAVGIVVGGLIASWLVRRNGRAAEDRAAQLEVELSETRSELEAQAERISSHFARTSDLFRDLTERYTVLYAHLADGARHFCAGEAPPIARGFDGPMVSGGVGASNAEAPTAPRGPEQANGGSPPLSV
jgi:uncharacterized membrane-anchored protein YhcB (DUF1043 family)